jgi:hypothetical protein
VGVTGTDSNWAGVEPAWVLLGLIAFAIMVCLAEYRLWMGRRSRVAAGLVQACGGTPEATPSAPWARRFSAVCAMPDGRLVGFSLERRCHQEQHMLLPEAVLVGVRWAGAGPCEIKLGPHPRLMWHRVLRPLSTGDAVFDQRLAPAASDPTVAARLLCGPAREALLRAHREGVLVRRVRVGRGVCELAVEEMERPRPTDLVALWAGCSEVLWALCAPETREEAR